MSAHKQLAETIVHAEKASHIDNNDLLDRVTSPVFDADRVYENFSYINASIGYGVGEGKPTNSLSNRTKFGMDTTYLLESEKSSVRRKKTIASVADEEARRFTELHLERPDCVSLEHWNSLSDELKFYRKMDEGLAYMKRCADLKRSSSSNAQSMLQRLHHAEIQRCSRLSSEQHYEKQMIKLAHMDSAALSERRLKVRLSTKSLGKAETRQMRDALIECGALPVKHEIVCAYCRSVCEPGGKYTRVAVINTGRWLVDIDTGQRLPERGVVNVWLCRNDQKYGASFFNYFPLPLAADLVIHIHERRQGAKENLKEFHRKIKRASTY